MIRIGNTHMAIALSVATVLHGGVIVAAYLPDEEPAGGGGGDVVYLEIAVTEQIDEVASPISETSIDPNALPQPDIIPTAPPSVDEPLQQTQEFEIAEAIVPTPETITEPPPPLPKEMLRPDRAEETAMTPPPAVQANPLPPPPETAIREQQRAADPIDISEPPPPEMEQPPEIIHEEPLPETRMVAPQPDEIRELAEVVPDETASLDPPIQPAEPLEIADELEEPDPQDLSKPVAVLEPPLMDRQIDITPPSPVETVITETVVREDPIEPVDVRPQEVIETVPQQETVLAEFEPVEPPKPQDFELPVTESLEIVSEAPMGRAAQITSPVAPTPTTTTAAPVPDQIAPPPLVVADNSTPPQRVAPTQTRVAATAPLAQLDRPQPRQTNSSREVAAASPPAGVPEKAIKPGTGPDPEAMSAYAKEIRSMITRVALKSYPKQSLRRKEEATIPVLIKIDSAGNVLDAKVAEEDGLPKRLREAALKAVRKAAPYPQFAGRISDSTASFIVQIVYRLR